MLCQDNFITFTWIHVQLILGWYQMKPGWPTALYGGEGVKVKCAIPHEECRWGAYVPSIGREPIGGWTTRVCDHGWCDTRPTVSLPSQPCCITTTWLVPNYTAWWEQYMHANNLPKVVSLPKSETAGSRTCDLLSWECNALTIRPPATRGVKVNWSISKTKLKTQTW